MNFSKDGFISNYASLASSDKAIQQAANIYFAEFKKSDSALQVSLELLAESQLSIQKMGGVILHQVIKEKIGHLIKSKEVYFEYHHLIFASLLQKNKAANGVILQLLCNSMSSIMCFGLYNSWFSINDILAFSQSNPDYELVSLCMLENIPKELSEFHNIDLPNDFHIIIGDKLKLAKDTILSFASQIIHEVSSNKKEPLEKRMSTINQAVMLISSWIKHDLNILNAKELSQILLQNLSEDTAAAISELFNESIFFSDSAKLYAHLDIYELEQLQSNWNSEQIKVIIELIYFIRDSVKLISFEKSPKTYIALSNIFSAIISNYQYLIFIKTEQWSSTMIELLYLFLCQSPKVISSRFDESLNELSDFVGLYQLSNFNSNEKNQFFSYLLTLIEGLLYHSQVHSLKICGKKPDDNNGIRGLHYNEIVLIEDFFAIPDECEIDMLDTLLYISSEDYRKCSEDMLCHLFKIIVKCYGEAGISSSFKWLVDFYLQSKTKYYVNSKDFYLKLTESCMFFLKSCADIIDLEVLNEEESRPLVDCLFFILQSDSDLLNSDRLVFSYLSLLEKIDKIIKHNRTLLRYSIQFLVNFTKIKNFEELGSKLIGSILENLDSLDPEISEMVYTLYSSQYDSFSNIAVWNLVKSLSVNHLNADASSKKMMISNIDEEKYFKIYENVLYFPIESNNKIKESLTKNPNLDFSDASYFQMKLILIKNIYCADLVFREAAFLSQKVLNKLLKSYLENSQELLFVSTTVLSKDEFIVRRILELLIKIVTNLQEDALDAFEFVSKISTNLLSREVYLSENAHLIQVEWNSSYKKAVKLNFTQLIDYINSNFMETIQLLLEGVKKTNSKDNALLILEQICKMWINAADSQITLDIVKGSKQHETLISLFDILENAMKHSKFEYYMTSSILQLFKRVVATSILPYAFKVELFQQICSATFSSLTCIDTSCVDQVRLK